MEREKISYYCAINHMKYFFLLNGQEMEEKEEEKNGIPSTRLSVYREPCVDRWYCSGFRFVRWLWIEPVVLLAMFVVVMTFSLLLFLLLLLLWPLT